MCVTMVDPAMDMLEIDPFHSKCRQKDIINEVVGNMSAQISRLVYKELLSCYPQSS